MKEKPAQEPKLPAMVKAYFSSGALADRMDLDPMKRKRFDSARQTLFQYMTPVERALTQQMEAEQARLRLQQQDSA